MPSSTRLLARHNHIKLALIFWLAVVTTGCKTALECSLNGECTSRGSCSCDPPWAGSDCGILVTLPTNVGAAYGFGTPFEVSSWGGNAIYDGADQLYHLFVTEMQGEGCGLHVWPTQSTVVHATSKTPEGPYHKQSRVLPRQASNPHAIRYKGLWYIFHIGNANASGVAKACNETGPGPFGPMSTTHQFGVPSTHTAHSTHAMAAGGSTIHKSLSPYGPFTPVQTDLVCNNPSPFVHPNGTLFVACTGHLFLQLQRSDGGPAGPWIIVASQIAYGQGYEDPFLFIDRRGNFHMLGHVWSADPYPVNPISGHAFSVDGLQWHSGVTQPYNNTVLRTNGTTQNLATPERPKLLLSGSNDPFRPTFIFNGASPYWGTGPDPCAVCVPHNQPGNSAHCSFCKQTSLAHGDKENADWTYTLVRPLAT